MHHWRSPQPSGGEIYHQRSQHAFLAPLARMYLAIPGSSATSESAFSSAGFLLDGRERLTTEHLEMQLIIRDQLAEWKQLSGADLGCCY